MTQTATRDTARAVLEAARARRTAADCAEAEQLQLAVDWPRCTRWTLSSVMNRSLTIRTGQCHVHRYLEPLLAHIREGRIDPTYIISHHMALADAPHAYDMFKHKRDDCTKIVLHP